MTAKVTNGLKQTLGKLLEISVDSDATELYYMALGRSLEWDPSDTPPVIGDSDVTAFSFQRKVRHALQSYKVISGSNMIVNRVNWSSGVYYAYDDAETNQTTNHYVVNSAGQVFLCLEQGKDASGNAISSDVEPSTTLRINHQSARPDGIGKNNGNFSFRTSDTGAAAGQGYLWQYIYKPSSNDINNYGTTSLYPVKKVVPASGLLPQDSDNLDLQNASVSGQILSVILDSSGSGYSGTPTISFTGNGTGGSFLASVSGGAVTNVYMDSAYGQTAHGSGYDFGTVIFSGGSPSTPAAGRIVLGPQSGPTADPVQTLRANRLMIQGAFEDTESGSILTENDFRQVAIILNPKQYGSNTAFTGNTAQAMQILNFQAGATAFVEDTYFKQNDAQGIAIHWDGAANELYFYQTEETGFGTFVNTDAVNALTGLDGATNPSNGSGNVVAAGDAVTQPTIDRYSGDILYIHNQVDVSRASNQTEDVKLIISF
jgi:hypothetical protein